jgi:hypothetical protein
MTDLDKLNTAAAEVLRLNDGNIKKAAPKLAHALIENARRPLLIALVADYLTRLPNAPVEHPDAKTKTQPAAPPKPVGRRRQGKHRRTAAIGTPTPHARAGAVAAMKLATAEIFNRKIRGAGRLGNIEVHQLRAISEDLANTTGEFVQRGFDDGVEAIALSMMSDHCVAADPFAKVVDVIPAKVAEQAFKDAKIRTAQVFAAASAKIAHDLIAAARGKPMIEGNETRQ